MAKYLKNLHIEHFRGIQNLDINELNHINIIVGDNNCGKTSILEALLLLRNPYDFSNVLRVARTRDYGNYFSDVSIYENFINLFSRTSSEELEISLSSLCRDETIQYSLSGTQKRVLLDSQEVSNSKLLYRQASAYPSEMEANAFIGTLEYSTGDYRGLTSVSFNEFSKITGREIDKKYYLKMFYLSPTAHTNGNIINQIVRNDSYKEVCLRVIQLFDPDIIDLLILKSEPSNRPVEYIKHKALGNMPISTYGDGIKKVLSLANAIAQSTNGVLLIDELETAIHAKYYDDIFQFIVKACMQFDVQLFITTHSLEAVDGLLATQDYKNSNHDNIHVITFKKTRGKTFSRVLSGRNVFENRKAFDFEVRL